MSKFEFVKEDGTTLSFSTKSIKVLKNIPTMVNVSLWNEVGKHISYEQLNEIGLKVKYTPTQTEERMKYQKITFMYNNVSQFSTRVTELKEMYDQLGVGYSSTVEEIESALITKTTNLQQRATWLAKFNATLDKGVALNYQAGNRLYYASQGGQFDPVDDFIVWKDFPVLVKWLPGTYTDSDIPVFKEQEIITTDQREAEIKESEQQQ